MKFVSLFAGVGGMTLGLMRSGMSPVALVEKDSHASRVLKMNFPTVPQWGDISSVSGKDLPPANLIEFGSPCQDLSLAGKRAGLSGEKSGLFLEGIRVIREMRESTNGVRPNWVVWENVRGALSSGAGKDFGAVLNHLADIGALDIEWHVLDAQYFGVPQRRRRVFVIARFGPGAGGIREVLPVAQSLPRNIRPGDTKTQDIAETLGAGSPGGGWRNDLDRMTFLPVSALTSTGIGVGGPDAAHALAGHMIPVGFDSTHSAKVDIVDDGQSPPVKACTPPAIAFSENQRGEIRESEVAGALTGHGGKPGNGYPAIMTGWRVRRLTPTECCRLMGWPDDWLDLPGLADSHKYRMCGNGIAAPVGEWIGRKILDAERLVSNPNP